MKTIQALWYFFLLLMIDGRPSEKAWGCGVLIVVLGILGLAGYGLYKLFG